MQDIANSEQGFNENTSNFNKKEISENTKREISINNSDNRLIGKDIFDYQLYPNPFLNETSIRFNKGLGYN